MLVKDILDLIPNNTMVIVKSNDNDDDLMAVAYSQTIRTDYRCDDLLKKNVIEIIPINDSLKLVLEG